MYLLALSLIVPLQAPQPATQQATAAPTAVCARFVDCALQPVADVAVGVVDSQEADVGPALAKPLGATGADGTLRIAVPVAKDSAVWLVIGGGRFATMSRRLTASATPIDLGTVALAPGCTGIGKVRGPDGAPLAGVRVVASDLLDSRPWLPDGRNSSSPVCRTTATTDAAGVFRLPGMVQSLGTLRFQRSGFFDEQLQPVAMGDPLDVALAASTVLKGRVIAGEGRAVASATVRAGTATTRCEPDGTFALPLRERDVKSASAFATVGAVVWSAKASWTDASEELQLALATPTATTDSGRVAVVACTSSGLPLPDFLACVAWSTENQLQYRPDALLLADCAKARSGWCVHSLGGVATPVGDSLFILSTRPDQQIAMVYAVSPGHAWTRVQTTADIVGGKPVVVTLPVEAVLYGRVTDESGAPIAGAELIPTLRLTDSERGFYTSGFRDPASLSGSPASTRTGADGCYELRNVPAGDLDLFVYVAGGIATPPRQLNITAGGRHFGVDFVVPSNVTLQGKVTGHLPLGARARVHWHRPNMSSGAWASEFAGAVDVGPDGAFVIPGLHRKPYEVQLVLPTPPRSGGTMKMPLALWQGADAGAKASEFAVSLTTIKGRVGGPVPWSRLVVGAVPGRADRSFTTRFEVHAPFAVLPPDRTFQLLVPTGPMHVVVLDAATGIPLEWREVLDAGKEVELSGAAEPAVLRLVGDAAVARGACSLEYVPEIDFWPAGVGNLLVQANNLPKCTSDARIGDTVTLWLPNRSGTLRIVRAGETMDVAVETLSAAVTDVFVGPKNAPGR